MVRHRKKRVDALKRKAIRSSKELKIKSQKSRKLTRSDKFRRRFKLPQNIYGRIAQMVPSRFRDPFRKQLVFAGIDVDYMRFVGFVYGFSFLFSFAIALNLDVFFNINLFLSWVIAFILGVTGTYVWLSLIGDAKARFVESVLPDSLQLMASNIRSGITTEKAIFLSARPEFGPLAIELAQASKEIFAGARVERALLGMTSRINSDVFDRTIWLITNGIKSGGSLEDLLTQIAEDLREEQGLLGEIRANISLYNMLIFFASVFGAPLLFGVSSFIVQVLGKYSGSFSRSANAVASLGGGLGTSLIGVPEASITSDFVIFFSLIALFIGSVFGSLTIGVINSGKEKNGLKYIPVFLIVSYIVFFLIRGVLVTVFSQLL